jgi:hypothetical protein
LVDEAAPEALEEPGLHGACGLVLGGVVRFLPELGTATG